MTFDLRELSRWGGEPIGLLRLQRGALLELYTTSARAVIVGAETYQPLAITRNSIRDSVERAKSILTLTLPVDAPVAAWWRPYPPSTSVSVAWLAMHKGDAGVAVEWTGRVVGPRYTDTQLVLSCEPTKTQARTRGLVLRWQRGCPLALYSQGVGLCNVDPELHKVPATVADVTGLTVTAAAFGGVPSGKLRGGFVRWLRPDGEPEVRSIMAHSGTAIVVQYGADSLVDGLELDAFPGCAHNTQACEEDFDNAVNYGGEVLMPNKPPAGMDGNPR